MPTDSSLNSTFRELPTASQVTKVPYRLPGYQGALPPPRLPRCPTASHVTKAPYCLPGYQGALLPPRLPRCMQKP
ncbi:hypothetical protein J4Q44_G00349070 [Coregonus suidteri]|uniref:Uncharacterized protein n=1 Tax=Coregonus suidteri TaxID=861788 RepID=A0AAN8KKC2_9TELE